MQAPTPERQHRWLEQLVGEWTYETTALDPDKPDQVFTGTESTRMLAGLWLIAEGRSTTPGMEFDRTIMTLGYDPAKGRFVGSFVGAMMTDLWVYEGDLDADERLLTLHTEGPSFTTPGARSRYRDTIEIVSDAHRIMQSRYLGDDGAWHLFMEMHHRRVLTG